MTYDIFQQETKGMSINLSKKGEKMREEKQLWGLIFDTLGELWLLSCTCTHFNRNISLSALVNFETYDIFIMESYITWPAWVIYMLTNIILYKT